MWQPGWETVWERMDTGMCMAESLCGPPETITTLLIGYTPIQNKMLKKKRKKNVIWAKCYCKIKEQEGADFPFGFDKMEGFGDYNGNGFVDMMGKKGWRG